MLVLNRRFGERLVIGDQITIRVLSVGKGRVKLGIEAPPRITVVRAERPARPLISFL